MQPPSIRSALLRSTRRAGLALGLALLTTSLVQLPAAAAPEGRQLRAAHSSMCVTAVGNDLVQRPCGGSDTRFAWSDGRLRIVGTDQCLDIAGRAAEAGAAAVTRDCGSGQSVERRGALLDLGARCLDVEGDSTAVGARLIQWRCHGNSNQQFSFVAAEARQDRAVQESDEPQAGGIAEELVAATNRERRRNGCRNDLRLEPSLSEVAQDQAEWMVNTGRFEHTSKRPGEVADRTRAAGWTGAGGGENIHAGYAGDVAGVTRSWMNSPGHRANILNCSNDAIGIGHSRGAIKTKKQTFASGSWVQLFGRS